MEDIGTDLEQNVATAHAPEDDQTRTFDVVIEAKAKEFNSELAEKEKASARVEALMKKYGKKP